MERILKVYKKYMWSSNFNAQAIKQVLGINSLSNQTVCKLFGRPKQPETKLRRARHLADYVPRGTRCVDN